jgi:hypothetical protein
MPRSLEENSPGRVDLFTGRNPHPRCLWGRTSGPIFSMALADQYKRRAAECVRMAERTDNPDDKALLLQMAQTWLRLAEKAEDRGEDK